MTTLLLLPAELLEQIYHYLDSIEDVHHFGRTCKAIHDVIRRPKVYTGIMRTIIGSSLQHRFDISLSLILELHRHVVQHFMKGNELIPAAQPFKHPFEAELITAVTSECPQGPCIECLPDERVHEILARYQGIRILENEWLARQLTDSDLLSADYDNDELKFLEMYDTVLQHEQDFRDGGLASRFSSEAKSYVGFNTDQRNRFYAAVTSVWLLNEIRWVLTHFQYPAPSFVLQVRLLNVCKQWVEKRTAVPLLDDLDRHAVFRFMYHHLLPIHGRFLADRCSSKLPLTFPSRLEKDRPDRTRLLQLFLIAGQTYLQPPDLIDLIVRSRTSRKRPYPDLTLPPSTSHYQHSSPAHLFPPSPPPTASTTTLNAHNARLLRGAVTHLNIIARATINQTEPRPQRRWVRQPDAKALFGLVDDSAAYLENKALGLFGRQMGNVQDFAAIWKREWWEVWWWANSEEKAKAKMERWRVNKSSSV